ncbi:MAG TPA: hypothetical protein VK469_22745, partial [Candidatus Kapabacteria bacterium]|nr:hypothetical protein [Candidatus Kapabacteria bacterium]
MTKKKYPPGTSTSTSTSASASANENLLGTTDFNRFISSAVGLFWRMKISEKRFEFFNHSAISGLSGKDDAAKLLQDLVWAQEIVVEEDFFRFK